MKFKGIDVNPESLFSQTSAAAEAVACKSATIESNRGRLIQLLLWLKTNKGIEPSLSGVFGSPHIGAMVQLNIKEAIDAGRKWSTCATRVSSFLGAATPQQHPLPSHHLLTPIFSGPLLGDSAVASWGSVSTASCEKRPASAWHVTMRPGRHPQP